MRRLASAATLLALAVLPASAHAAVTITDAKIQPSTTAAGAHPNLTIDLSFGQSPATDDLKDLTVVLPQGLVGNPKAADRCSQASFQADACPAGSKVGTTTVTAVPTILAVEGPPQDSPGDVYNLAPLGAEPARLGVVVRPTFPGASKIFLQSAVTISAATDYGLRTTFTDIPRVSGQFDSVAIRVTRQVLTLNGTAAHGPFITNPTSCLPAEMTVTATSWDDAANPDDATASFTPTACEALPYSPSLSGSIGGAGNTAKGAHPEFATTIETRPGDANTERATVALPSTVTPNIAHPMCKPDELAANVCPSASRVGAARAESPTLDAPLTGPVWFVNPGGGAFPQLAVQLSGPVAITLTGFAVPLDGKLATSFANQPDLPLERFDLKIDGGENGLLTNNVDLCAPGADSTILAEFVAHSGAERETGTQLVRRGCQPAPPTASYRLRPGATGHRILSGRFTAGVRAPKLTKVRVTLPPKLSPGAPNPKRRITAFADGKKLGPLAIRVRDKGRRLGLILKGARTVTFTWRGLVPRRGLAAHPRVTTEITDARGKVTLLSPPAAR